MLSFVNFHQSVAKLGSDDFSTHPSGRTNTLLQYLNSDTSTTVSLSIHQPLCIRVEDKGLPVVVGITRVTRILPRGLIKMNSTRKVRIW
jgi:hypothetical protein